MVGGKQAMSPDDHPSTAALEEWWFPIYQDVKHGPCCLARQAGQTDDKALVQLTNVLSFRSLPASATPK
jgi:hypothetical protein